MFVLVCLSMNEVSHLPTGWPHGHGLQPTVMAMAKMWTKLKAFGKLAAKQSGVDIFTETVPRPFSL